MTARRSAATMSRALKTPRVLLAWDAPTASLSAGWTRYVLERRFGQAVTAVRTGSLGRANFADYDVIVLPSGNYAGADQRRGAQPHQGLAARRRHARHDGRGHALGDRQRRRAARHDALLKDGRPDTPATTGRRRRAAVAAAARAAAPSSAESASGRRSADAAAPPSRPGRSPSRCRAAGTRAPSPELRLRQGDPARSRAARRPARRAAARHASTPITG